jgi:predicted RNA-binding protein YlqC (UPF0109 family)
MKALVQSIVDALVDHSDEVLIKELHGENITIIELSVAREDLGKVIGRNGRTITAIRTILNAAGATQKKRVVFEVLDSTGG